MNDPADTSLQSDPTRMSRKVLEADEIKAILGQRFFGLAEWQRYFPDALQGLSLSTLPLFPWRKDILESPCPFSPGLRVKDTHFAFLGLSFWGYEPLTLLRWHYLLPHVFDSRSLIWYGQHCKETWAITDKCQLRWYLMPLANPKPFDGKSYYEQLDLLPKEYEVSDSIAGISKLLLHRRLLDAYPEMQAKYCWYCDTYSHFPETRIALCISPKHLLIINHIPDRCRGGIVINASLKRPGHPTLDKHSRP